jgi:hypothetical protein
MTMMSMTLMTGISVVLMMAFMTLMSMALMTEMYMMSRMAWMTLVFTCCL